MNTIVHLSTKKATKKHVVGKSVSYLRFDISSLWFTSRQSAWFRKTAARLRRGNGRVKRRHQMWHVITRQPPNQSPGLARQLLRRARKHSLWNGSWRDAVPSFSPSFLFEGRKKKEEKKKTTKQLQRRGGRKERRWRRRRRAGKGLRVIVQPVGGAAPLLIWHCGSCCCWWWWRGWRERTWGGRGGRVGEKKGGGELFSGTRWEVGGGVWVKNHTHNTQVSVAACVCRARASSDGGVALTRTSYGDSSGLLKAVPQSMDKRGQAIWIHL